MRWPIIVVRNFFFFFVATGGVCVFINLVIKADFSIIYVGTAISKKKLLY